MPMATTDSMEQFAHLMRRLWNGETVLGHTDITGTYPVLRLDPDFRLDIPLSITVFGDNTLKMAGRAYDNVILHTFFTDETTQRAVQTVKRSAEEAGRDPASVKVWSCFATVGDHIDPALRLKKTVGRLATYLQAYGDLMVRTNKWDPAVLQRFREDEFVRTFPGALDAKGTMTGYKLKGVGMNAGNTTREGNFPSGAVDHLLIESVEHASTITTNAWRAPITNFLAYAEQSFLDEVALAAGKDPVDFRMELLNRAKTNPVGELGYDVDRMIGVVKMAKEKSNWGKNPNVKQGFSVYFSQKSYVAQVADIDMQGGVPTLKKITAVTDCGLVVNPTGANHQVRGGIVDGMGHAMYTNLTFEAGVPKQRNFDTYRLIRLKEVPEIDTHFVDSGFDPTGLGEPALPPTGGAIANAIFAATGRRLRSQPFIEQKEFSDLQLQIKRG
jgi:hypothetical protein